MNDTSTTPVYCHHCGAEIVFNRTFPDKSNSHWAHAIRVFNGKAHSLENALMEQRCADRIHWATPKRRSGLAHSRPMLDWERQDADEFFNKSFGLK